MQQLLALTRQYVLDKRTNGIVWLVATLLASLSLAQSSGGPSAVLADLQRDWRSQKVLLVQLAEAMPAEKFTYRPTPAQRTYGEQIIHIAAGNIALTAPRHVGYKAVVVFIPGGFSGLTFYSQVIDVTDLQISNIVSTTIL